MMSRRVPFLARFSEEAPCRGNMPPLIVGSDGLLRRLETEKPYIDELTTLLGSKHEGLATYLTEANLDHPDPDTIRRERCIGIDAYAGDLDTFITRAPEQNDPDLIRVGYVSGLATSFTNGRADQPDPDWFRRT